MDLAGPWRAAFICLFTVEMYAQMRTVIESGLLNLFRLTENQPGKIRIKMKKISEKILLGIQKMLTSFKRKEYDKKR